ncbi:hypothetical protein BH20VER1_BH20VER1_19860 [soil metagenome]
MDAIPFFCRGSLPFGLVLVLALASCSPAGDERDEVVVTKAPAAHALSYSVSLLGGGVPGEFIAVGGTTSAIPNGLAVTANDVDPQVILPRLNLPAGETALRVVIESPAETRLQLYYQTASAPDFDPSRIVTANLKKGANSVLLIINEPELNGVFRLDPGEVAGTYLISGLELFTSTPLAVPSETRTPEQLAGEFFAADNVVFSAAHSGELKAIEPVKDVTMRDGDGFTFEATSSDPNLLLPEFPVGDQPLLIQVIITVPKATTLQVFWPDAGGYDEGHAASQQLQPGKNTVFLKIPAGEWSGRVRLDPGMVPGSYTIDAIEIRSPASASPE